MTDINAKNLERGLRISGDRMSADFVRDLTAENARLREALIDCEAWIRRYHYADRPDLADNAKEALK